jgi:branched-chain amino acid transport system substrate-binding protein
MKKYILWCIVVLAGVGVAVWYGVARKPAQTAANPIRIGAILELTGNFASQGENSQRGMELAIKEINQNGGILGRPLQAVYQDNKGDKPQEAIGGLNALVAQNVRLVIGPNLTPSATALAPLVESRNVLLMSPSVGSEKFAGASKNIFDLWPPDIHTSQGLAEFVYQKGYRRIAIFASQQEWEKAQGEFVKQKFEALGGTVANIQFPLASNTDLKTEASKIQASNPEVILFTNYGETGTAAKRLRDLGVTAPFFSVLIYEPEIAKAQGALENTVFITSDVTTPEFMAKFKAAYNTMPSFPAANAYDSVYVLAEAMRRSGSTEVQSVVNELASFGEWKGASGIFRFDADGNAVKVPIYNQVMGSSYIPYKSE